MEVHYYVTFFKKTPCEISKYIGMFFSETSAVMQQSRKKCHSDTFNIEIT